MKPDCGSAGGRPWLSLAYKNYALAAMTTVYTVNLLDRGIMALLLQPIKEDLHLSDTQLGFVTGIAFGLFYATLGVPIARWADRGNRVTITSAAIGLWGLTAMACALVTNYAQLLLARVLSAVGESGCKPPIYSLLGDYFPRPAERTRAMYVWDLSNPIATLVSFMAAGWLNELFGWRTTFLLVGLPGLFLALLFRLTIREPRQPLRSDGESRPALPPMSAVLSVLWHQQSCRHLTIAMILIFTMAQGLGPWYAAFMIRSHGMGTAELGVSMGLVWGFSGLAGLLAGAYIVGRWFANNERGQLRIAALSAVLTVPCFVAFLTVRDGYVALSALVPESLLLSLFLSPISAFIQRLVPNGMRATVFAVVMLLANLIGMGVGPQLVGILSDVLTPKLGSDGLRYAMLAVSLLVVWAAYHLIKAGRTINQDLAAQAEVVATDEGAVGNRTRSIAPEAVASN